MIKSMTIIFIILGAGLVSLAYVLADYFWLGGLILFAFVGISLINPKHVWISSLGLFLITCCLVIGILEEMHPILMYSSWFLSLAGWDLANFTSRIQAAGMKNDLQELKKRHLTRLGFVLAVGIVILLISINIKLKIGFTWAVVLIIISTLGLGQLVNQLLKQD